MFSKQTRKECTQNLKPQDRQTKSASSRVPLFFFFSFFPWLFCLVSKTLIICNLLFQKRRQNQTKLYEDNSNVQKYYFSPQYWVMTGPFFPVWIYFTFFQIHLFPFFPVLVGTLFIIYKYETNNFLFIYIIFIYFPLLYIYTKIMYKITLKLMFFFSIK